MNQSLTLAPPNTKKWLILAFWLFVVLFAGKFILNDALPYYGLEEEVFGRYWEMKWPLIGHISGGLLALVLGPFQFWVGFRNKYLNIHRWMGRLYLTGILVGTISSVALAVTTGVAIHISWAFSLVTLAMAWFFTSAMALRFILLKRVNLHKEWMIRSYVVTFAFVLFRWLNGMDWIHEFGNFSIVGPNLIWISWAIPLFITEIILQWNKK